MPVGPGRDREHASSKGREKSYCRELTVANIRERKGPGDLEVVFLESARLYKLTKANPSFDKIQGHLRDALATRRVLKVRFASQDSDVIEQVNLS